MGGVSGVGGSSGDFRIPEGIPEQLRKDLERWLAEADRGITPSPQMQDRINAALEKLDPATREKVDHTIGELEKLTALAKQITSIEFQIFQEHNPRKKADLEDQLKALQQAQYDRGRDIAQQIRGL